MLQHSGKQVPSPNFFVKILDVFCCILFSTVLIFLELQFRLICLCSLKLKRIFSIRDFKIATELMINTIISLPFADCLYNSVKSYSVRFHFAIC